MWLWSEVILVILWCVFWSIFLAYGLYEGIKKREWTTFWVSIILGTLFSLGFCEDVRQQKFRREMKEYGIDVPNNE